MEKLDKLSIIDDLQKNLFSQLGLTWGFHPGFTIRVQVYYMLHLIDINEFKSSFKGWNLKINAREILKLCKSVWIVTKFRLSEKKRVLTDVLVVGYKKHEHKNHGKEINIYTEPVKLKLMQLGIKTQTLYLDHPCSDSPLSTKIFDYYKSLIVIESFIFSFRLKFLGFEKEQFRVLKQNELLLNEWLDNKKIFRASEISQIITNAIIRNQVCFNAISKLVNVLRPKLIWTYGFYDNEISSISRVAYKQGIRLVDYQHSQQSDHHFAYARWENIDEIRPFFPSTFWVWRRSDGKRILKNFSSNTYQPEVKVGGNLWLASHPKKKKGLLKKKSVLISLQGSWIPQFIEDYITSNNDFMWYFRLHPRYPTDKDRLVKLYNRFSDRIVYKEANELPLYEILSTVSINITGYSGVALEAFSFGVKNIIFGEQGLKTFKEYIQNGVFDFVEDQSSLKTAMLQEYMKKEFDPIIEDETEIGYQLMALLK